MASGARTRLRHSSTVLETGNLLLLARRGSWRSVISRWVNSCHKTGQAGDSAPSSRTHDLCGLQCSRSGTEMCVAALLLLAYEFVIAIGAKGL